MAIFTNLILDNDKINCKLSQEDQTTERHTINDENLEHWKHEMQNTNWDFLDDVASADEKFSLFESKYSEIYNKNFPKNRKKLKKA